MFCPNCGKKCEDTVLFCWNCGAKMPACKPAAAQPASEAAQTPAPAASAPVAAAPVASTQAPVTPAQRVPEDSASAATTSVCASGAPGSSDMSGSKDPVTYVAEGVIFTNMRELARKLATDAGVIRKLLSAYAETSLAHGIRYHLIDAADYRFLNPEAARRGNVSLTATDSWVEHANMLADYYRYGRGIDEDQTNYLFIVGGEDVVPMPVLPHYVTSIPNFKEKSIDSDIPYAYLLGERTYPMLKTGGIFQFEQYFHVGRLPFATDASLDDLAGYLRRAAKTAGGMKVERYFGLANLPWHEDSQVVCEPLRKHKLYTGAQRFDVPIAANGLFASPPVVSENIHQIFDTQADLYYFNLHGSDAPTASGFYADEAGLAIGPNQFAAAEAPNLFVTEACYGAKFEDLRRSESMLLTAMCGMTLLYLGSSRIAWCNNKYSIDNSDLLTRVYIDSLLEGYTAGEALFFARQVFLQINDGRLYDQQQTTIVEFNIFGDPFLRVETSGGKDKAKQGGMKVMTKNQVITVADRKCLYSKSAHDPLSLLGEVREAVDHNIAMIRETVNKELYARFGVEPRQLSAIFQNRFTDGEEFYSFDYDGKRTQPDQFHVAITDKIGNIKTIISTK